MTDIDNNEPATKGDFLRVRNELKSDVLRVRNDLKEDVRGVEDKLESVAANLTGYLKNLHEDLNKRFDGVDKRIDGLTIEMRSVNDKLDLLIAGSSNPPPGAPPQKFIDHH